MSNLNKDINSFSSSSISNMDQSKLSSDSLSQQPMIVDNQPHQTSLSHYDAVIENIMAKQSDMQMKFLEKTSEFFEKVLGRVIHDFKEDKRDNNSTTTVSSNTPTSSCSSSTLSSPSISNRNSTTPATNGFNSGNGDSGTTPATNGFNSGNGDSGSDTGSAITCVEPIRLKVRV